MLARLRAIAPSGAGDYQILSVSGRTVDRAGPRVTLRATPQAYEHASHYLDRHKREDVAYRGRLVSIDFERGIFGLRHEGRRIRCRFDADLRSRARVLADRYVEVEGVGVFREDSEVPATIVATRVRQLTREEQAEVLG